MFTREDGMARGLSVKGVEAAAPRKDRQEIPDAYLPGFYLIVQPSGAKSWAVRYRHEGRPRKHTIGTYPLFDLKAAREAGTKALRLAAEGIDPATVRKRTADSVEAVVEQFLDRHVRRKYRPKPMREVERYLHKHVLDKWHGRKISDIGRADIRALVEPLVDDAPIAANRLHSIVRTFFGWALEQDIIAASPCAGLKAPAGKEGARDRILDDDELRRVWQAAEELGAPFGAMVQFDRPAAQRSHRDTVVGNRFRQTPVDATAGASEEQSPP
jgi:hypothetical protein